MNNISFLSGSVDDNILPDNSQDFGYCLGVLHHVPDTFSGLQSCSRMLKKGAPFLLYLYYNFENKPVWFKIIWKCINIIRVLLCKLPFKIKKRITSLIAFLVYWPLARFSLVMEKIGLNIHNIPLSSYRWKSFYSMRTDALDRFGTKIEKRFSKKDIKQMLNDAGFERVSFSEWTPFWTCVAYKS